jgi:type II secretory pathway pseudopilin PulG
MKQWLLHRGRGGSETGMSLIEVVVACVLLGIFSSAVLAIILQTQSLGASNRARIAAASLAAREIDIVRDQFTRTAGSPLAIGNAAGPLTNPDPVGTGAVGAPTVINGVAYTVVRDVAWNITANGASPCSGGSLVVYPTLGVTVTVTWPGMGSVKPVVSTASLAPLKSAGIPLTGAFVAVQVKDSLGQVSVGRTVTVTGDSGGGSGTDTTDSSGCAVIQVSPATGGSTYTATVSSFGYVDISGNPAPQKSVGLLAQGQLSTNVTFGYDRAATVTLHVVDSAGNAVTDPSFYPAQVTTVASQFSGSSGSVARTVAGPDTTISGLWPTSYGAYFGGIVTPEPPYTPVLVAPGATAGLNVPVEMATSSLTNLPAGSASVVAVPGSGTCPSGGHAVVPAGFSVTPGNWTFFATGPTYICSPGPTVSFVAGSNDPVVWGTTTLKVNGAPSGGTLWAVNRSKTSDPSTVLPTCPGAAYTSIAWNVDAARTAPLVIPAGDWYVYRTDGAAAGACLGTPSGLYSMTVAYGVANTLGWVAPNALVTVTGAPNGGNLFMLSSSSSTVPTCTKNLTPLPTGYNTVSPSGSTFAGTFTPGTWYFYSWDQHNSVAGPRCVFGGSVIVGGRTTYTLPFNKTTTPVVGP